MSLTLMPVLGRAILHTRLPHPALILRRCLVSLQFDKPWLANIHGRLTYIWRETLEEELIGGGEGAERLSFLYPVLQQSGQRSPKHPIKQLNSFQESHGLSVGNTRFQHGAVRIPQTSRALWDGSGFTNTWEQACAPVFKQLQHIIKGCSQANENQSTRPEHLVWKYWFFKDFCILN